MKISSIGAVLNQNRVTFGTANTPKVQAALAQVLGVGQPVTAEKLKAAHGAKLCQVWQSFTDYEGGPPEVREALGFTTKKDLGLLHMLGFFPAYTAQVLEPTAKLLGWLPADAPARADEDSDTDPAIIRLYNDEMPETMGYESFPALREDVFMVMGTIRDLQPTSPPA